MADQQDPWAEFTPVQQSPWDKDPEVKGPWTKYQTAPNSGPWDKDPEVDGPWTKYQSDPKDPWSQFKPVYTHVDPSDFQRARDQGVSDADTLEQYQLIQPHKAAEIQDRLKQGEKPSSIVDSLAQFHEGLAAGSRSLTGALRQGAAGVAQGEASTLRTIGAPGSAGNALDSVGRVVAPTDYTPASETLKDKNATWGQWAKAIPYALAESAPGIAQDLGAGAAGGAVGSLAGPIGAAIGGAVGFGGSYLARNFGDTAKEIAVKRTGDANAEPSDGDKAKALLLGSGEAALSRFGLGKALSGPARTIGEAATQVGKGAAIDAGTSAAITGAHSAVVDGKVDPQDLVNSAAIGATTGAGLRVAKGASDVNNSAKFSAINPTLGKRLAARFEGEDVSSPSDAFGAVNNVQRRLDLDIGPKGYGGEVGLQLKALKVKDPTDDTGTALARVQSELKAGNTVDPEELQGLRDRLRDWNETHNLVDALEDYNNLNALKSKGNFDTGRGTFGGGMADTDFVQGWLKPFATHTRGGESLLALGGLVHPMLPHALEAVANPGTVGAVLGGKAAAYGVVKGADAALGNTNPAQQFVTRFADHPQADDVTRPEAPSFRATWDAMSTARALGKLRQDQAAKQQTGAQRDLDAKLAAAKFTSRVMQNSQGANPSPTEAAVDPMLLAGARARAKVGNDSGGAPASPEGTQGSIPPEGFTVAHDDQTVDRPATDVISTPRYAFRVAANMKARADTIDDAKQLVPAEHQSKLNDLLTYLNSGAVKTRADARQHIDATVSTLPPEVRAGVRQRLNSAKLLSTWNTEQ